MNGYDLDIPEGAELSRDQAEEMVRRPARQSDR